MFTRLREPFGKAGLIVAIVALVAATVGGAYAASHGKRHNKKGNAVAAQAKRYSKAYSKRFSKAFSKRFATPGPAGPQGPAGSNGNDGAAGAKGDKGDAGTNGTNGVSPTGAAFSGEQGGCTEGGVKFTGANTTYACNGVKGEDGETGFTETLPSGKTLKGTWAFGVTPPEAFGLASISFGIPLAEPPLVAYVAINGETFEPEEVEGCEGSVEEPLADPGYLCVYESSSTAETPVEPFPIVATGGGVDLLFTIIEEQNGYGYGSWAVTAE